MCLVGQHCATALAPRLRLVQTTPLLPSPANPPWGSPVTVSMAQCRRRFGYLGLDNSLEIFVPSVGDVSHQETPAVQRSK